MFGVVECFVEMPLPQPQVGHQRLHPGGRPFLAAFKCFTAHHHGQVFGLAETTLVEPYEGEQTEGPAHTIAVAEPFECLGRTVQALVGQGQVAREKTQPCSVLLDVRQATFVAECAVGRFGFPEEPLGILCRTAEQFDEPALT